MLIIKLNNKRRWKIPYDLYCKKDEMRCVFFEFIKGYSGESHVDKVSFWTRKMKDFQMKELLLETEKIIYPKL